MVEIYSKSLVRAIGEVLLMKFRMAFVWKQRAVLVVRINNIGQ